MSLSKLSLADILANPVNSLRDVPSHTSRANMLRVIVDSLWVSGQWDLVQLWTPDDTGELQVATTKSYGDQALQYQSNKHQVNETFIDSIARTKVEDLDHPEYGTVEVAEAIIINGETVGVIECVRTGPKGEPCGPVVSEGTSTYAPMAIDATHKSLIAMAMMSGYSQSVGVKRSDADSMDPLTGILSRTAVFQRLNEALADPGSRSIAVLFCDLDGFKGVNDSMGHTAGDQVLREVAQRLTRAVPDGDTVARLGGDEFLIICRGVNQVTAEERARSLIALFSKNFRVGVSDVTLGISIGIALATETSSAENLVLDSDAAMYSAKRLRSGCSVFSESLHTAARERREVEHDLRNALHGDQMRVVYQPVLQLQKGTIVGAEALLRWFHPVRGEISPAVFVPIAESIGLIDDLGRFALKVALFQYREWMNDLGPSCPKFIAVNVSPQQLLRPDFVQEVVNILALADVPASSLTLEITESVLMTEPEVASAILTDLAELGISLDIDDFGTGYSALAYLAHMPFHALKIDKSFIWGLGEDQRITTTVLAILSLAQRLGLACIAEGVETAHQLSWLRDHGCEMVQGFHISRPVDPTSIGEMITSGKSW